MRGKNAAVRTTNHALPSPREIPLLTDTVRMPWDATRCREKRVVPPALAVLYRVAVGPAADYYVPRFLRFERGGLALPGWHWPAMLAPGDLGVLPEALAARHRVRAAHVARRCRLHGDRVRSVRFDACLARLRRRIGLAAAGHHRRAARQFPSLPARQTPRRRRDRPRPRDVQSGAPAVGVQAHRPRCRRCVRIDRHAGGIGAGPACLSRCTRITPYAHSWRRRWRRSNRCNGKSRRAGSAATPFRARSIRR